MSILGAAVLPHPPLIVPQVGRGEAQVQPTIEAYRQAARHLVGLQPDTLIIISPHSPLFEDGFYLGPGAGEKGDLRRFGAPQVSFEIDYDQALGGLIAQMAAQEGLSLGGRATPLDHGVTVPLHFLREQAAGQLPWRFVRLGISGLDFKAHYRLGSLIARAAAQLGRSCCVIASGDLSHYLRDDGPYGYREEGPRYDAQVMDILSRAAFDELLALPEALCEQAGECGQRSFVSMAGCFDGLAVSARQLSYQDLTGVGYGVVIFEPGQEEASRRYLGEQDPYVALARQSMTHYVTTGRRMKQPDNLPQEMTSRQAGVFVSLHLRGELRGCIGTIAPTQATVADEIIDNAISAAVRDPRFPPVREVELAHIDCSVDVLEPPEDITSPDQLDVERYGVIVSLGARRGLLLPNLEGVDSVAEQIDIARRKAGIPSGAPYQLQRFRVVRHQ